jgi:hypothetical protein
MDGSRAVCIEGIRDVIVKGTEGDEKVFVGIERRVGWVAEDEGEEEIRSRLWEANEEDMGMAGVVERRNLVFMRELAGKTSKAAVKHPSRVVKREFGRCVLFQGPAVLYETQN